MTHSERAMNVVFGLNIIAWGVLGLWSAETEARFSVVRICISCLHFTAGVLFLLRRPLKRQGSNKDLALAIPSLVMCGVAFRGAHPIQEWPRYAEAVFAAGTLLACVSLFFLGRSFAVLPAVRDVVSHGPYRWVRHPAYAGELLLILACALAVSSVATIGAGILVLPLIALRIQAEERTLRSSAAYKAYQQQVRWKLCPYIW